MYSDRERVDILRKKKVAEKTIQTPVAIINITPSSLKTETSENKKNVMFIDAGLAKDSNDTNTSSSASFEMTPKRSKSEANRD